ncbi:MAG: Eco57I restriction-modification methylase domain-containing protein [Desulfomonilaceae bacterium]
MSIAKHHAEWLSLIDISGPFLSMPVLMRVFPQGLDTIDKDHKHALRSAFEEWEANNEARKPDKFIHSEWVRFVLEETLGLNSNVLAEGQAIPPGAEASIEEYHEILRPDLAVINPPGFADPGRLRMLVKIYPTDQNLEKPVSGSHWKASPSTRMTELLRKTDVPLGLITNGENWTLVHAPQGETTGFINWSANLWTEEELTLRAFISLLSSRRFFNCPTDETLENMLVQSASDQQEVTDQLGFQVRKAVEVLIRSMDLIDADSRGQLLAGVDEKTLYQSALTIMMRLVFLFCAEERELLLLGDPIYDQHYAVSTLRDQLRQAADRYGEEVLERRFDAWSRLMATFRAVYAGVDHEQMSLPAYGGDLFDPDRFPFLEGRPLGSQWKNTLANPLPIDNRTTLHLLEALQMLQTRVPGASATEARRLSFRALDIEQIGHVYEGLLDHTAKRARKNRPVLALIGTTQKEPEIELEELEALRLKGHPALCEALHEQTGKTAKALENLLNQEIDPIRLQKLVNACGNDESLWSRVKPCANLVRDDTFGRPVIIAPGRVYVTSGEERRSTGTHYTPRSLTESIVQHTLEPLAFEGPAEGWPKSEWKLKTPAEILDLKIVDMAMGSGAFLVQACRWLSERLIEAWEDTSNKFGPNVRITPYGEISGGLPSEVLIPDDPDEKSAYAKRLVCDRCLYGVDKNPMAVDMAKLSLWLITLDKGRAFTFLDHALKCGDSLLGLSNVDQVMRFHIVAEKAAPIQDNPITSSFVPKIFKHGIDKRNALESFVVFSIEDSEKKADLLRQAEDSLGAIRSLCDLLIADAIKTADGAAEKRDGMPHRNFETRRSEIWARVLGKYNSSEVESASAAFKKLSDEAIREINENTPSHAGSRRPFHWPVEFPEVFANGNVTKPGFSAVVGNPPFMGGQKITGNLGVDYRNYMVDVLAKGKKGSADLCAYFFLRANEVIRPEGMVGLLATNTIAQGDSREVGLDQLAQEGVAIPRAVASRKWPGTANLEVSHVWLRKGDWKSPFVLDEQTVKGISPLLQVPGKVTGNPYRLAANADKSFIGSYVLGMGFIMSPEEAQDYIDADPKNKDVVYLYLNGEDLNSRPDQSPSRWVINFHDWPLRRAESAEWRRAGEKGQKDLERAGIAAPNYNGPVAADYPEILKIVEEKVKPERTRRKADGSFALRYPLYLRWWIYGEKRPKLYSTISGMERVLVRAQTANLHSVAFVSPDIVYAHKIVAFPLVKYKELSVIQSNFHNVWLNQYASTLRTDISYTPSDCFETVPFPESLESLEEIGGRYYTHRQSIMLERWEGLTKTYNRFHKRDEDSSDITELRRLHEEMDHDVAAAYGWTDLDLAHGFHETKQGIRYTVSEPARREILDRLLALNHERHEEEVKKGLHEKDRPKSKSAGKRSKKGGAGPLFDG